MMVRLEHPVASPALHAAPLPLRSPPAVPPMKRATRTSLLLACLVCALLRLPAFGYDVISDDEAIYHAMSRVVASGGVMYRDTVDHKPPGLVYTYAAALRAARALGGSEGALGIGLVHLLGLLAAVGTCLALFGLARRVLAEPSWTLAPWLYAVVSAAKQPVDGLSVNGELLMNLPLALAALCAVSAGARPAGRRALLDLAAGALCAVGALYKYQAAVLLFALPALFLGARRPTLGEVLARLCAWGLGFAAPFALTAAYFHQHGALDDAIRWGLLFNRSYLAEGPSLGWALERLGLQLAGVVLPGAVLYVGGAVTLWRLCRRRAESDVVAARAFLVVWGAASLACVALGGRFFGHYFLQPELPLSLLAAGVAARMRPRWRSLALGVPAAAFFAVAALPGWTRPLLNAGDPDYLAIGRAVQARTTPEDTLWVWGNVPQLYYGAERRAGVRFTFCNYLTGLSPGTASEHDPSFDPSRHAVPWAWPLVFEDLERRRPALILDTAAAELKSYGKFPIARFAELARYLAAHYRPDGAALGVVLYRRVD